MQNIGGQLWGRERGGGRCMCGGCLKPMYIQELSRKYPDISVGLNLLLHHILVMSAHPETLTLSPDRVM